MFIDRRILFLFSGKPARTRLLDLISDRIMTVQARPSTIPKSHRCSSSLFLFSVAVTVLLLGSVGNAQPRIGEHDWPFWRGPNRNGIASSNQNPPTEWSKEKNILWKSPVPGKGHGSPTILGQQVFITVADLDRDVQSVICFDRDSGKQVFETIVHRGGLKTKGNKRQNKKASLASTTVATDGEKLYVNFLNDEAVWTSCYTMKGKFVWKTKISDYIVHQGYGSSPTLFKDLVIVSADNKGGGMIRALRKTDGETVWKRSRPAKPNYPSPALIQAAGKTQLVFMGCDLVTSLDPLTGKQNWEIAGATTECVSTTVTDGTHIFTSGGYPTNHISAVKADGSGTVVWQNNSRVYVPSMLCYKEHLYAVLDAGVAVCYESATGKEKWKARLGGNFSGSPIMVNDLIFATSEKGETTVFKVNPEEYERVAKNKLGDHVLSTPAICGGRIFIRAANFEDGKRKEYLYCIGEK